MKYHYSFHALQALEAFLKTAYPDIKISIENEVLTCGCIEIAYKLGHYNVDLYYLGSTRVKLGSMTVEQIANLVYLLHNNKESFIK